MVPPASLIKLVRCVCWGFQQLHGISWYANWTIVVTKYWPNLSWWAASRQATLLLPTKARLLVVSMQARTALSTSQELSATLVQCDEMHTHAEQFLNVDMIPAWVSNQWSLRLLSMLRPHLRLQQDSQHTAQYRVVMHDAMSYLSKCRAQQQVSWRHSNSCSDVSQGVRPKLLGLLPARSKSKAIGSGGTCSKPFKVTSHNKKVRDRNR